MTLFVYMTAFELFKNQNWEYDFRTHPKCAPLAGVLVESRNHPDLGYALRNFSCMLPFASLTIFYSDENLESIMNIIGPDTNIRLVKLPEPFGRPEWIRFSLSPNLWDQLLDYEKVLIFNVDTGLRHNSILKFIRYDFIGAHWNHLPVRDPLVFQGNGALSIRNPKLMKEITEKYPCPTSWNLDDVWLVWHLVHKCPGSVLPTKPTCAEFSTEGNDIDGTMGFHDTDRYTPGAWRVYELEDGPHRTLVDVRSATVDGRDVTALVRLGVGPNGLRLFRTTELGGQRLIISTSNSVYTYDLIEGRPAQDIHIK